MKCCCCCLPPAAEQIRRTSSRCTSLGTTTRLSLSQSRPGLCWAPGDAPTDAHLAAGAISVIEVEFAVSWARRAHVWQHSPRWQHCPTVLHHGQETRAVMSCLEAESQAGAAREAALQSSGIFPEVLPICRRTFSYCHPFSVNHVLLSSFSYPAGASLPSTTPCVCRVPRAVSSCWKSSTRNCRRGTLAAKASLVLAFYDTQLITG